MFQLYFCCSYFFLFICLFSFSQLLYALNDNGRATLSAFFCRLLASPLELPSWTEKPVSLALQLARRSQTVTTRKLQRCPFRCSWGFISPFFRCVYRFLLFFFFFFLYRQHNISTIAPLVLSRKCSSFDVFSFFFTLLASSKSDPISSGNCDSSKKKKKEKETKESVGWRRKKIQCEGHRCKHSQIEKTRKASYFLFIFVAAPCSSVLCCASFFSFLPRPFCFAFLGSWYFAFSCVCERARSFFPG